MRNYCLIMKQRFNILNPALMKQVFVEVILKCLKTIMAKFTLVCSCNNITNYKKHTSDVVNELLLNKRHAVKSRFKWIHH